MISRFSVVGIVAVGWLSGVTVEESLEEAFIRDDSTSFFRMLKKGNFNWPLLVGTKKNSKL